MTLFVIFPRAISIACSAEKLDFHNFSFFICVFFPIGLLVANSTITVL